MVLDTVRLYVKIGRRRWRGIAAREHSLSWMGLSSELWSRAECECVGARCGGAVSGVCEMPFGRESHDVSLAHVLYDGICTLYVYLAPSMSTTIQPPVCATIQPESSKIAGHFLHLSSEPPLPRPYA